MATYKDLIEEKSGITISDVSTDATVGIYLADGYKDVVNKIAASSPGTLDYIFQNINTGWKNNTHPTKNHFVASVRRKGIVPPADVFRSARKVGLSEKDTVVTVGSIHEATEMDPVYYIENKKITVIPDHTVNSGSFEYTGIASPNFLDISASYPSILSDSTGTHSTTDSSGTAGAAMVFALDAGHGFAIGDTVSLSDFTELTSLNGMTTTIASISTNDITLSGVLSDGTIFETSATAKFYRIGAQLPEDFSIYLILYTCIKLIELKLSDMNTKLAAMISGSNASAAPSPTEGGWEVVRYYIQDEEDPELAGVKLQELGAEQQQWAMEYKWYQERLQRVKSDYLEPFATATASEGAR